MLKTTEKLLPRSTTSYSFWLSLSSCSYINFANVQVTVIAACFMCPATSFRFSRLKIGCQNAQKCANFLVKNLEKFRKFTVSSISHLGDIKEVSYKDWKMSLYKPGQVRACFCWITEKSQIIQLKISFHHDNFRVDFFQRHKFCHI